jgi:hypothetical protein
VVVVVVVVLMMMICLCCFSCQLISSAFFVFVTVPAAGQPKPAMPRIVPETRESSRVRVRGGQPCCLDRAWMIRSYGVVWCGVVPRVRMMLTMCYDLCWCPVQHTSSTITAWRWSVGPCASRRRRRSRPWT